MVTELSTFDRLTDARDDVRVNSGILQNSADTKVWLSISPYLV